MKIWESHPVKNSLNFRDLSKGWEFLHLQLEFGLDYRFLLNNQEYSSKSIIDSTKKPHQMGAVFL